MADRPLMRRLDTRQRTFFSVVTVVAGLTFGGCPAVSAQTDADELNRIKAAFVVNIARFVNWPAAAPHKNLDDIALCVFGDQGMASAAASFAGQKVDGKPLTIRTVASHVDAAGCSVLLVPGSAHAAWLADRSPPSRHMMLTVIDQTEHADNGPTVPAPVTLVRNQAKISFDVNLTAVDASGLKLRSQLLSLAREVHRGDKS